MPRKYVLRTTKHIYGVLVRHRARDVFDQPNDFDANTRRCIDEAAKQLLPYLFSVCFAALGKLLIRPHQTEKAGDVETNRHR